MDNVVIQCVACFETGIFQQYAINIAIKMSTIFISLIILPYGYSIILFVASKAEYTGITDRYICYIYIYHSCGADRDTVSTGIGICTCYTAVIDVITHTAFCKIHLMTLRSFACLTTDSADFRFRTGGCAPIVSYRRTGCFTAKCADFGFCTGSCAPIV